MNGNRAGSRGGGGRSAREIALEVLLRIETDRAYANLALGPILERSGLTAEDRAFVTKLVYGTTRMRRACDALIDRFVSKEPDVITRQILRLGAFQLAFGEVASHAAVSETVTLASGRSKGFVNAVLRRIGATPMVWTSEAERLSYPEWIYERLRREVGEGEILPLLEKMNRPAPVSVRGDGYVQDIASQEVVHSLGAREGESIVDVCAGPGGKATGLAASGAAVVALDISRVRAELVASNAVSTGWPLSVVVSDARSLPLADESAHRVLVDAPCSGLGVLRRRPDARWRIREEDIAQLAVLQNQILSESARLVHPGGILVYSVCTLTAEESIEHPIPENFVPIDRQGDGDVPALGAHWESYGHGARLMPHRNDSDGMVLLRYRRSS